MIDLTANPKLPRNERLEFCAATGAHVSSLPYRDISIWLTIEDTENGTSIHGDFYGKFDEESNADPHAPFDMHVCAMDPYTLCRWYFTIMGAEITEPNKFIARVIINWR